MRAIVSLTLLLSAVSLSAQPVLRFGTDKVEAVVKPGASVVYAVVAQYSQGYVLGQVAASDRAQDSDADGVITLADGAVPMKPARWVAIDISSGASTVASPDGQPATVELHRLNPGELKHLATDSDFGLFVLVRPGVGAWKLLVQDTDRYDGDSKPDGKLKIDIERMIPIGSSPAPPRALQPDDVVFFLDPSTLRVAEFRR